MPSVPCMNVKPHHTNAMLPYWRLSGDSCGCNANGRSQNALLFLHHKENAPWKYVLHSHLFWNIFQVELYTSLPQRCTFYHSLQILMNWRINAVIMVNSTQVSLKWIWIINNYVCSSLISLCWLNKTRFWNLLSELFFTLRLSEMLFFINWLMSIFVSTYKS